MEQKFFEIIPHGTKINFMKVAPTFLVLSMISLLISVGLLSTKGLNYGVDFKGGTEVHVRFNEKPTVGKLREALSPIGLKEAMVQEIGEEGSGEFLIRVETVDLNLATHKPELEKAAMKAGGKDAGKARIRFSEDRIYVSYASSIDENKLKEEINALQLPDLEVDSASRFGRATDHEYLVQFAGISTRIIETFHEKFGRTAFEVLQTDQVGPKVGKELRMQAVGAVIIAIIFILIYIWFRFEFEFAPGAIIALIHDAVVILGVFSFLGLQFDLSIVAAVLTIVGYSINDTIVLYDRVRENVKKSKEANFIGTINDSVNQTLSRTILTSGTALIASVALMLLGGPITYNFALAFTIGIVAGTYSSVLIASPVTIYVRKYLQKKRLAA